jgi:hypothetical protein
VLWAMASCDVTVTICGGIGTLSRRVAASAFARFIVTAMVASLLPSLILR